MNAKNYFIFWWALALSPLILASCGEAKGYSENEVRITEEVKSEYDLLGTDLEITEFSMARKTYQKYCHSCHNQGLGGAPKIGHQEIWVGLASKGLDTLTTHVYNGFKGHQGIIPMKGTCMHCSEEDIRHAIIYLLSRSGVSTISQ